MKRDPFQPLQFAVGGIMRKSILLVAALVLVLGKISTAQNNCVAVRGLAQETLADPSHPGYPWSGQDQLIFGDILVLKGTVLENDGTKKDNDPAAHQSEGGRFIFDFGSHGMFTVLTDNSVYPFLPKQSDIAKRGTFHGQGPVDISSGTGRFSNASGNFTIKGDFLAMGPPPYGRFNVSISGFLCNLN
jgi:hypothetical protein